MEEVSRAGRRALVLPVMSGWRRWVIPAVRAAEEWLDRLRFGVRRRAGRLSPVEIMPYRGHGTRDMLFLKGRVLEVAGIAPPGAGDSWHRNLRNTVRRFLSSEIPYARVRATYAGREVEATADEEGFFDLRFELAEPMEDVAGWRPVEIELLWPRTGEGARATGSALVLSDAGFCVVSDLDDTVVRSNVTSLPKMALKVLLGNARTRLPFEGVAAFYQALQRGRGGGEPNPIFYVSNGPWNLYDLLVEFLDLHGVPAGPLFLRDWSPTALRDRGEHKLGVIRGLLATYPDLPFVLIGDSGERDPEIYDRIVHEYPGRIEAVYIRDVTTEKRDAAVREISDELRELGVDMLLTADTAEAAEHAAALGLIAPDVRLASLRTKARERE